jgi:hypothetical protein
MYFPSADVTEKQFVRLPVNRFTRRIAKSIRLSRKPNERAGIQEVSQNQIPHSLSSASFKGAKQSSEYRTGFEVMTAVVGLLLGSVSPTILATGWFPLHRMTTSPARLWRSTWKGWFSPHEH